MAANVTPDYAWFDGTAGHYLLGDHVEAIEPIPVNTLFGSYDDPDAKIVPVKVHRANQIYDPVTKMLIQPKLVGTSPGDGGFWKDFDWGRAADAGWHRGPAVQRPLQLRPTEMTWPINHMVAPKERAVRCDQCHTRDGSRLAGLHDFYLPGRDRNVWSTAWAAPRCWWRSPACSSMAPARVISSRKRRDA